MKKSLFTILHTLDKNIWGEHINSNKYLATITLLFCTLFGVILGGGNYLGDLFDWNINISTTASIASVIVLIGYNIAESIIAADSAKIAALRALMMCGIMILGFVAGLVGSVILLIILTIIIGIYIIILVLKLALFGEDGGREKIILEDGTELTNKQSDLMLGGGASYTGNDGYHYHTDDGRTFRRE
jgi:hypothetical protein